MNSRPSPKDMPGLVEMRALLKNNPSGFVKQLAEIEQEYEKRVDKWEKEEQIRLRQERMRAKKAARSREKPKEEDPGTERALQLCVERLRAIAEETK